MNSNVVHPNNTKPPENPIKVTVIAKNGTSTHNENECSSTCSCEEEPMTGMQKGVTDTVWKAGCYKINPTTQSGESYSVTKVYKYAHIYIIIVIQNIYHNLKKKVFLSSSRPKMFLLAYDGFATHSHNGISNSKFGNNEYHTELPGKSRNHPSTSKFALF